MHDTKLLTMIAETPVHAGTGSELGAVDLPIQRERHTELPTIHGSGLKGVLRDRSESSHGEETTTRLFGSPPPRGGRAEPLEAGALNVGDARLLLFPVRTVGPVFAWVTSPYCLARLRRDLASTGHPSADIPSIAVEPDQARVCEGTALATGSQSVILEEFELPVAGPKVPAGVVDLLRGLLPKDAELDFWRGHLARGLVVVHDDLLRDLVRHATEVVTRVQLDSETKTVKRGALWTEEYLPADSLCYAVVALERRRLNGLADPWGLVRQLGGVMQVGGKESVGRGFFRTAIWPE